MQARKRKKYSRESPDKYRYAVVGLQAAAAAAEVVAAVEVVATLQQLTQGLREQVVDGVALQKGVDRLGVAVQIDVPNAPQQPLRGLGSQQPRQRVGSFPAVASNQLGDDPVPVIDDGLFEGVEKLLVGRQLAADGDGFLSRHEGLQGFSLDPVYDRANVHGRRGGRRRRVQARSCGNHTDKHRGRLRSMAYRCWIATLSGARNEGRIAQIYGS